MLPPRRSKAIWRVEIHIRAGGKPVVLHFLQRRQFFLHGHDKVAGGHGGVQLHAEGQDLAGGLNADQQLLCHAEARQQRHQCRGQASPVAPDARLRPACAGAFPANRAALQGGGLRSRGQIPVRQDLGGNHAAGQQLHIAHADLRVRSSLFEYVKHALPDLGDVGIGKWLCIL